MGKATDTGNDFSSTPHSDEDRVGMICDSFVRLALSSRNFVGKPEVTAELDDGSRHES